MTERPILFSESMVRAIRAGTKTQTRRVVKSCKDRDMGCALAPSEIAGEINQGDLRNSKFGQLGDRLWVREAWRTIAEADHLAPRDLNPAHRVWMEASAPHQPGFGKLRPSLFMPRWASAITLEITSLRIEKLQDISIEDSKAEGAWPDISVVYECEKYFGIDALGVNPRLAYRMLWEQINGAGAWATNPWVWVVAFKQVEVPQ